MGSVAEGALPGANFGCEFCALEQRGRQGCAGEVGEREIGVVHCNEMEARLLHLKTGDAALVLRLVNADASGRPIEYLRSINHPQLVLFRTAREEERE